MQIYVALKSKSHKSHTQTQPDSLMPDNAKVNLGRLADTNIPRIKHTVM